MAKKHTKHMFDFDESDQQAALDRMNEAMDNNYSFIESSEDYENESSEEDQYDESTDMFMGAVSSVLSERFGYKSEETSGYDGEDEEEYDKTPISYEDVEPVFTGLTIRRIQNEFDILEFSDGIKSFTIDLNSLIEDPEALIENRTDGTNDIIINNAIQILRYGVTNWYPSAILSNNAANKLFGRIQAMDENKFIISDYYDESIKFAYYIDEDSLNVYEKVVRELIDRDEIAYFLIQIANQFSSYGFTFKNLSDPYTKSLMILKRFKDSAIKFEDILYEDEKTIKSEKYLGDVEEHLIMIPYDASVRGLVQAYMDMYILEEGNNEENYPEEEYSEDPLGDDVESEEVIPASVVNEDTEEEEPENEQDVEYSQQEDIEEEDNEDPLGDDIEAELDKAEQLEAQYFGNGRNRLKSNQPKKYPKNTKPSEDYDEFVVTRR